MTGSHLKFGAKSAENESMSLVKTCLWWLADRGICRNRIEEGYKRSLLRTGGRLTPGAPLRHAEPVTLRGADEDNPSARAADTGS